jgi:homocysteine S-methyltransferase
VALTIADGGLETTLIFHEGLELPAFAAFPLLEAEAGRAALAGYVEAYLAIARDHGVAFALDTATWRANTDWGRELGYSPEALADANRRAVGFARELRDAAPADQPPVTINGAIGPRGDAYRIEATMTVGEAEAYHRPQLEAFADAGADSAGAYTLTYAEEAAGIVRAARAAGLEIVPSFTVETDGRLPSGERLADAIDRVDAETDGAAAFFMINCAHPTHFAHVLDEPLLRVGGLRANASARSHAELDESEELDDGDPADLAARYVALREALPNLRLVGGCCGTDHRHVRAICEAMLAR